MSQPPNDSTSSSRLRDRLWAALPLVAILVLVGLLCNLIVAWHQANRLVDKNRPRAWATRVVSAAPASLILEVSYPQTVLVEPSSEQGQPLVFWLLPATPTATPIPSPTPTPSPMAVVTSTATITATPIPSPNPTSVTPVTYTLFLEPHAGSLLFTDKDGVPILPRFVLTSPVNIASTVTMYVHRESGDIPSTIPITVSLYTHDYDPVDTFPVTINTEGEGAAVERLRIDQLLGPSTPLLGLLAAIGAFLIEEYRGAKKRQQDAEAESREAEQAQAERQFKERMTQQEHEFQERMELDRRRFQQEQDERKALQGRLRAKMAFLADIEQLRVLVVDSPAQAARKYLELSIKVPDELLNDVDCRSQLAAMRELLDLSDWRRPLLEEAATHFQEGRDSAALVTTGQLIQLDPQHEPALLLDTVLGFAAKTGEDRKRYLEKHGVSQVIEGLQHIDRQYGNRELGTPIRERVSGLLARLIEAEHIDEVDRLLGFTEQGLDLLREPECQKKLRELSSREDVSPDLTATSKKLISRCEAKVYWVVAWACPRPEVHDVFRSWLELAEFTFNPFGPDMAETDPYLKQFSVNPFEKQITGARPVLVIGKSGAGKTALALMQAHSCNHPLELPQEPSAFPVYYRLVLEDREAWDQRTHLEYIARATSRAIIRYLTLKPNGFLELTPSRREAQVELLLICSGSYERLVRELRQVSEDTVSTRLLRAFEAYRVDVRQPDQVTTQMWLDLLRGSVPAALTRLYVLADVADAWGDNVDDIARRLLSLLSLRTPLEEAGVYLKVFVPERFRAGLGRISGFATATLSWDRNDLYVMLKQRIKQARRDQQSQPSLSAICNPGASGMGVDDLLIAASTTPRDVVHWGNRLLEIHVTRDPDEAYLSEEDVEKWQSELNSAVRANGEGLP